MKFPFNAKWAIRDKRFGQEVNANVEHKKSPSNVVSDGEVEGFSHCIVN